MFNTPLYVCTTDGRLYSAAVWCTYVLLHKRTKYRLLEGPRTRFGTGTTGLRTGVYGRSEGLVRGRPPGPTVSS